MNRKFLYTFFYIHFFFSSVLSAQIEKERFPLSEILTDLQKKYKHDFTYADETIKDIFIKKPSKNLTLKEVLSYLQNETELIFQILEHNFVAIKPKEVTSFVCGYVIDYETKTPIEAVTVSGQNKHTITDAFGYFKLNDIYKNEEILIQHLSYYSKSKRSFYNKGCPNIYLTPQIESLSEVVLTNYIAKGIDKLSDGTFHINFHKLGILPGLIETDVLQTIQALPGIQSVDETISNINIRGGTNDQNLLLWDGIKMYQSGHFFGLISIFNPLITTEASVVKNGTNVDFSNAVSGTIEMKTAPNINNTLKGSIGLNFIDTNGHIDLPLGKKSSLQISVRKALNEFIKTPTYTNYFDRILNDTEVDINTKTIMNSDVSFDFYDTSFRWLYNITDKDQLRINFLNVNNELEFNENAIVGQLKQSRESSLTQKSISEGVFYKRKWNAKFVTTLQLYETDYQLKAINSEVIEQQRLLQENEVSETSIQLNTWYKTNLNLSFLNGYQFIETGISNLTDVDNPVFREFITEVVREHALYSQLNYISNTKKTTLKAGIRYNYIEKFNKHIIEPRFSLNHKFSDWFSVEISGETKHQNTSQIINFQNDFLGIEKRRWQLSNDKSIPIITSQQISLGFNFRRNGWLINAEGYFKEVEGITTQSQGFLNQYEYIKSIGSYHVNGIDLLVNKRFKKWNSWLSYSYVNNEYVFADLNNVSFPNNLDITNIASFGASFSAKNFKISTGVSWHSGKPTTRPIKDNEISGTTINYELANSSRIRDYFRVDASATQTFKLSSKIRAILGVSIWNGLNHKNIINNYYQMDTRNTIKSHSTKALRFTPNFSFRVFF